MHTYIRNNNNNNMFIIIICNNINNNDKKKKKSNNTNNNNNNNNSNTNRSRLLPVLARVSATTDSPRFGVWVKVLEVECRTRCYTPAFTAKMWRVWLCYRRPVTVAR